MGQARGQAAQPGLGGPAALIAFGGLLAWGFSTRRFGLVGGAVGYPLMVLGLGAICARSVPEPGWRPSRQALGELWRSWCAIAVVVLSVSVGLAFGLPSVDPVLTRQLGLAGLLGVSNWFASPAPLPAQLAQPNPLLALAFTSVALQLVVLWWVLTRIWRRAAAGFAAGLVVLGLATQLLWLDQATTAFFATATYALPFGLGALAALGTPKMRRLPNPTLAWVAAVVLGLAAAWTFGPSWTAYRFVTMPLACVAAAAALSQPLSLDSNRLVVAARLAIWPAVLGFAVRALLGPDQLHLHGVALTAAQLVITAAASLLGCAFVAWLPRSPVAVRPLLGLLAVPALVFTLVLVGISQGQFTFPPGPLHPGTAPIVAHAFPNPKHHLRTLMVGGTDALGLSFGVPASAERRGVMMNTDAVTECGLVNGQTVDAGGGWSAQVKGWRPGVGWVRCSTQLARWRADLRVLRPKVVLLAEGSSEVRTWLLNGRAQSILDPAVRRRVRAGLERAIAVLASRGAQVVVTTAPYYGVGVPLGRYGNPANDPDRVNAYNRLLRSVAAATGASVYNLNAPVCPARRFQLRAHGIVMRGVDGVTLTAQGGRYVQPGLLATLKEVAR